MKVTKVTFKADGKLQKVKKVTFMDPESNFHGTAKVREEVRKKLKKKLKSYFHAPAKVTES